MSGTRLGKSLQPDVEFGMSPERARPLSRVLLDARLRSADDIVDRLGIVTSKRDQNSDERHERADPEAGG